MKKFWLVFLVVAVVAIWVVLSGHSRRSLLAAGAPTLTVMSYNVGDENRPSPEVEQIKTVILRAGVPDLLLLQDNTEPSVIPQLARQLRLPFYFSGRQMTPTVNASILSRYPLTDAESLFFESSDSMTGVICANVRISAATIRACSLYMPSLSSTARKVVGEQGHEFRDVVRMLWDETFNENPRSRSMTRMLGWLAKDAAKSTIIGGDFNTFPQSRAIRAMHKRYEDALWFSADNLTGTYIKLDFPVRPRIDYLFHSGDLLVEDAAVVRNTAGDHYPVRARLILPASTDP